MPLATMDDLVAQVQLLDTNTTALLTAVNASRVGLTSAVASADADAIAAAASALAASISAAEALSSINTFRSAYYGALAVDPTLDPNGGAMTAGDLYFNSVSLQMMVYRGVAWVSYETEAVAAAAAALASATAADASEAAALASQTSATASATAADASEAAALASQTSATASATSATASATSATASATSATASATSATASATAAAASEAAALASQTSATASATSATASATSATASATSATASATSATASATSATASATAADASEAAALGSEFAALASENAASASAIAADASEAGALNSQNAAAASATTATAQATISTDQATISTAQAVISTTQAGTSTTKATEAAASAAAAAASAAAAAAIATGALVYQGVWDASTLVFPTPTVGITDYYKVSVAGGIYAVGDSIIYNGVDWDKIDNTEQVTSVAGKVGAVTLVKADVGLPSVDNTSDVDKPVSTAQALADTAVLNAAAADATSKADAAAVASVPAAHAGAGGAAHANAVAAGAAGFMTGADKTKLDGVEAGANNYSHPANHLPSIITQDANNRFVTDAEKTAWNASAPSAVSVVAGTTQTAVANTHYILTNVAATTVTLPVAPAAGDMVWITWANSLVTNVVARNGQTIMGLAENMTLDTEANGAIRLRFVNSSWRLI